MKAIVIFLLTLALVIWKPRGLGMGFIAVGGALLALAIGIVQLQDVPAVWVMVGNAMLSAIASVIIALILNEAGFWRWLGLWLAKASCGRGRLFFMVVLLLGASVTASLSNYTTALIWTPTLMEMLLVLGFSSKAIWAFVFATGFIADASSLVLPASNPVNLIVIDYFHISPWRYVLVMIPVHFVAIATGISVLWYYFDRCIPLAYTLECMPPPDSVIKDALVCQWSFPILGLLLIGYFFTQPLGIPTCSIAVIAALLLLALAGRWHQGEDTAVIPLGKVLREVPWQLMLFGMGISIIVLSLRNTELTPLLSQLLKELSGWGLTQVAIGTGFLAALLSSVINNLPAVMLNASAIKDVFGIEPTVREVMVYGLTIGCDLGAKITPIGSLSTLLWVDVITRQGQQYGWVQYIGMAFILTIPVLFVSLLGLAMWLPWLIA